MKKQTNKPIINKDDFLKELSKMSVQDVNRMIESKGKPVKLVMPVLFNVK